MGPLVPVAYTTVLAPHHPTAPPHLPWWGGAARTYHTACSSRLSYSRCATTHSCLVPHTPLVMAGGATLIQCRGGHRRVSLARLNRRLFPYTGLCATQSRRNEEEEGKKGREEKVYHIYEGFWEEKKEKEGGPLILMMRTNSRQTH